MTANENDHFLMALKDFKTLKLQNQIPPQMLIKLLYLLQKIQPLQYQKFKTDKSQAQIDLLDLPDYEKHSLDQIEKDTGIQLFINITNCLSGKDIVLYLRDQKAHLRKDETFSMWGVVYLAIDSNRLIIFKKPTSQSKKQKPLYEFKFEKLKISKNFKQYKKKSVFGVCYNNKNGFLIGFDQESACSRVHELLRSLAKDRVRKIKLNQESNLLEDSRITYDQQSNRGSLDFNVEEQIKQQKSKLEFQREQIQQGLEIEDDEFEEQPRSQHIQLVLQYIQKQQLLCDQSFRLLRNQQNFRELVHKKYPNILKSFLVFKTDSLPKKFHQNGLSELIMESYLLQNQWNPQIQTLEIVTKLSDNLYLLNIQTKKYSYFSWPRSCKIFAMGLLLQNGIKYLVLRGSDDESDLSNESVKMEWNQVIQIRETQKMVLMTILSEFDFKGYSSLEDNQKMGLKLMKGLEKFTNFIEMQVIYNKKMPMFMLKQPLDRVKKAVKKKRTEVRKLSQQSQFELPDEFNKSEISQPNTMTNNQFSKKQQVLQKQINKLNGEEKQLEVLNILKYKLKSEKQIPKDELITCINSNLHQKYYLKHHFDQQVHLQQEGILHQVDGINNYINQGGIFTVNQANGDVIFYDEKIINLQKDIIKMIIKQLGSNLMSGKSIMNMSLPVEIFDDKSILQRVAMGYGYLPYYMPEAGQTTDIVRQAELVTLTVMGILPLHLNVCKPFNPILGQTFECTIKGIPLFFQQISHHPPITAMYIKGQNFRFYGNFHSHAEMGINQVVGRNLCPLYVEFPKTNTFYEIKMGSMEVNGIMYGDRSYRGNGKCFIYERTNNIFVEYSFGECKKKVYEVPKNQKLTQNIMIGGIYTVNSNFGKKFQQCEDKKKFKGLKPDDIIQKHVEIKGHWAFDLFFNQKKVKSMKDPIPYKIEYPEYVLPSDSNFRLDLIYKKRQELQRSNQEKQVLENLQRRDRKLRQGKIK